MSASPARAGAVSSLLAGLCFVLSGYLALTLEIINLTDRDNACCIDEFIAEPNPDGSYDVETQYDYWLGFNPVFSVLWQF